MGEIIPIFKSHYSLGRSILTLNAPKEVEENESSDSVFDICEDAGIKEMYLVSDGQVVMGKKAIMGALKLYLDFINLFIMLLHLFGNRE